MNWLRNNRTTASLHWLLALAMMLSVCLPVHYHLHHLPVADAAHHAHALDLHFAGADHHRSHHEPGTTIIETAPDRFAKNMFTGLLPMSVLAILLLLLPVFTQLTGRHLHRCDAARLPSPPRRSPPLRAPPRR